MPTGRPSDVHHSLVDCRFSDVFSFVRYRSAGIAAEHSARFGIEAGREIMQRMESVPEILANKDKNCRILQKRFASHLA